VIFEIIFWISVLALAHTYLIFPVLLRLLSFRKKGNQLAYNKSDDLPDIGIVMAVRNEERIIETKIRSIFNSGYPVSKIRLYIGSDASGDKTDEIIRNLASTYSGIEFEQFKSRQGKIVIINKMAKKNSEEILIFTDVHAILEKDSLYHLIKHFRNPGIHVVGGQMKIPEQNQGRITYQEMSYFENEYKIKHAEGKLWGCMIGAFGAFYAVRRKCWAEVPANFISDDFYISVKAIEGGGKAIFEPEALVVENVSGTMNAEFKRKARIATGNFQNLKVMFPILFSKNLSLAFCFFSHKILRWLGPIFIILAGVSLSLIFYENLTYTILFIIMLLSMIVPFIDFLLDKFQIHVVLLRFVTHFYYMNIAMLAGLLRFMKGVKTNVWEPTKRN
jgi:cellulose synthase/poly-beta-1,6-N-acetylglucosamine synthase-like glycosyltransferase